MMQARFCVIAMALAATACGGNSGDVKTAADTSTAVAKVATADTSQPTTKMDSTKPPIQNPQPPAPTSTSTPPAPSRAKSTLEGVYSAEQAKRGESSYGSVCASCHNSLGNHTGPVFRQRWAGSTVGDLFTYMMENMPKGDPGALTPQEYVDLTAYLLKTNDMPPGKTALPADAVALAAIRFDTLGSKK